MIRSGDVEPAFAIFARFQQRNRERIRFALAQLDKEPDWTIDETFEFDREKAPWAATSAELDELWRKRVKNDGLSLLLTGKTWDEASKLLQKRYESTLKRVDQVSCRRRVRDPHEFVRAHLRSALQLFLAAQLRGIPHPDEPQLRRHRCVAAAGRRLRDAS